MEDDVNWRAPWVWVDGLPRFTDAEQPDQVYFRRKFLVSQKNISTLIVQVSADSRYRLYLNGISVSIGPCKGDRYTHYFETIDLTDYLQSGINVLAAKVIQYPNGPFQKSVGPDSVWSSNIGAFTLQGDLCVNGKVKEEIDTDERWVCLRDQSLRTIPETFTLFVGKTEEVNGALAPHGWEGLNFDDQTWKPAVPFSAASDPMWGLLMPWRLTPRPIPPMYEKRCSFKKVKRSTGVVLSTDGEVIDSIFPLVLEPFSHVVIEFDAGELTTGYLNLAVSKGEGSTVQILSSECYEEDLHSEDQSQYRERKKGIRDNMEGNVLLGPIDLYHVGGIKASASENFQTPLLETYQPFWFRTFRFVQLNIQTSAEPLILHQFDYDETGYPLEVKSEFRCSDERFVPFWNNSLTTLKRCMHETYEDCPFYEQMQYAMDTRLQILFTYQVSGDDLLARRALYDFHSVLLPSGLLETRNPTNSPHMLPGFSLYWVMMVYDHYLYYGDENLLRRYLPTIEAILMWYERRVNKGGLVGRLPESYWAFVDWVEEWKPNGVPPASLQGPATIFSLLYITALRMAEQLNIWCGRSDMAREYKQSATIVETGVRKYCFSTLHGLVQDGPSQDQFSQHCQIWSVISGVIVGEEARNLLHRMINSTNLPKASHAMSFYLFRAMSLAGIYEETFPLWERWQQQVELNLTTWIEDPVSQRSDCHGWSALPLYECTAELLGVLPDLPGYQRVRIAPQPGITNWAGGCVHTPHGSISIHWEKTNGKFSLKIDGDLPVPAHVILPDGKEHHMERLKPAQFYCNFSQG